ncbi:hypothetical protein HYH02_008995 [Chlamydomonas schloesseri]|uniref:Uncharacterized protein n=1 Tax=Chlamydomonas schloesseri TaxID=2026947 RepID=A0A836B0P0_9CHLO|nr:hypothetical protein HYH02_008995 [Chlamydomonas schloesseri]|eukprot:KAG2444052.1 hypothetical protein HYH02_008995 [Chlamydomonas schloesseri]
MSRAPDASALDSHISNSALVSPTPAPAGPAEVDATVADASRPPAGPADGSRAGVSAPHAHTARVSHAAAETSAAQITEEHRRAGGNGPKTPTPTTSATAAPALSPLAAAAAAGAAGAEAAAATATAAALMPPSPADDAIDVPRLHQRLGAYAAAYGLPAAAAAQLAALLATPLAARLLAAPPAALHAQHLVTDAYKPRMHVMYDKYMTGVTADFALVVRRAPPAADPAALPTANPVLWRRFTAAAAALSRRHIGSAAVSGASTVGEANAALAYEQRNGSGGGYVFGYGEEPYGPYEVEALRTQFGLELPATLLEQCRTQGVAAVTWQRIGGGVRPQPLATASAAAGAAAGGGGGGGGGGRTRLPLAQSPVNHPHQGAHDEAGHSGHPGHRLRHRGFPPPEGHDSEAAEAEAEVALREGDDVYASDASESEDGGGGGGGGQSGANTGSGEAGGGMTGRAEPSPRPQAAAAAAAAATVEPGTGEGTGTGTGAGTGTSGDEATDYAGRVAIASGPIVAASLAETTLMQLFQETAVQAQAASLTKQYSSGSSCGSGGAGGSSELGRDGSSTTSTSTSTMSAASGSGSRASGNGGAAATGSCTEPYCFDRTERLANSLVRLALTVERINGLRHGLRVALFAGRRSSDLLYLLLQNLYAAAHLHAYAGTSSLFAAATVCRHWAGMHVPERERWGGPGRLVGTHAHEMSMALQQLLAPYDAEAGRRAGLRRPLALSPLLAHLLFLAANGGGGPGGGGATALADTFTTPAFISVARAAAVPPSFRRDVESEYGWSIPEHARCFDLFRVWRIDSGRYEEVAGQVVAAWEERCAELAAAGRPPLRLPHLMHSNLDSVEQIAQVAALPERIRPSTLAFGTLADGFLPFLPTTVAAAAAADAVDAAAGAAAAAAGTAQQQQRKQKQQDQQQQLLQQQQQQSRPTIGLASVVMKLVQARPPRPLPPLAQAEPTTPTGMDAAAGSGLFSPKAPPPRQPPCAVKLGDGEVGPTGTKAQVDPRLPAAAAQRALQAALDLAHTSTSRRLDEAAVSAVLSEAYDAITRDGVLMAAPAVAAAATGATE